MGSVYGGRTDKVGQDEGLYRLGNLHLPSVGGGKQLVGFFDINMTKLDFDIFWLNMRIAPYVHLTNMQGFLRSGHI